MESTEIQYVSDERGNAVAVVVPIELWRAIASERETVYFLSTVLLLRKPARRLEFDTATLEALAWWDDPDFINSFTSSMQARRLFPVASLRS